MRRRGDVEREPGAQVGRGVLLDAGPGGRIILGATAVIGERCELRALPGAVIRVEGMLDERCKLVAAAGIVVEAGARLGPECALLDGGPKADDVERPIREQGLDAAPIRVAAGALLGPRAVVLRGVTVGAAAVVLAQSVCHEDVPAGAEVGGTPAREV